MNPIIFLISIALAFVSVREGLASTLELEANSRVYHSFNPEQKKFSLNIAVEKGDQALLSNRYSAILMYWLVEEGTKSQIEKQFSQWGFLDTQILEKRAKGYRAVIAEHETFIFFAIRGTKSLFQIVTNGQFATKKMSDYGFPGHMHAGFADEFIDTREMVEQGLLTANAKEKPVIAVGHSRGTSQIIFHMSQFKERFGSDFQVYAYAAPKLGDTELNRYLEKNLQNRIITINYALDMTPNVPMTPNSLSYLDKSLRTVPGGVRNLAKAITSAYPYDFTPGTTYVITEGLSLQKVTDKNANQRAYWTWFGEQLPSFVPVYLYTLMKRTPENHVVPSYIEKLWQVDHLTAR